MMPVRLFIGALVLGGVLSSNIATAATPPMIRTRWVSVGPITYAQPRGAKIGSKRAGLLCFPNGALNLRDLADVDEQVRQSIVADTLTERHFTVRPEGLRLSAEIVRVSASLCAPRWGLRDRVTMKGTLKLDMRWRMIGAPTETSVEVTAPASEPSTLADMFETALRQSTEALLAKDILAGH